jgi:hypothetical protein
MMTMNTQFIDDLLARNEVVIVYAAENSTRIIPYRGRQIRSDVLRFLAQLKVEARAVVFSHVAEKGPIGIDVLTGEKVTWR